MCGLKEIRYVHTVAHTCGFELEVGCVCCDNLTGNAAERAEREKKLRQARRAAEQEAYRALCGDRFDRLAQAELALRQRKDLQANMRKVRQWQGKPSKYLHSIWNGLDLHLIRVTRDKMRRPIPRSGVLRSTGPGALLAGRSGMMRCASFQRPSTRWTKSRIRSRRSRMRSLRSWTRTRTYRRLSAGSRSRILHPRFRPRYNEYAVRLSSNLSVGVSWKTKGRVRHPGLFLY